MQVTNPFFHHIRNIGMIAFLFALLFGHINLEVHATAHTVTDANDVLYTVEQTVCYADANEQSQAITVLDIGIPIQVTGITSNGWFQIALGGTYYVKGTALAAIWKSLYPIFRMTPEPTDYSTMHWESEPILMQAHRAQAFPTELASAVVPMVPRSR